jgi:pimeloyl-ACP methyl ester carboxylesterase
VSTVGRWTVPDGPTIGVRRWGDHGDPIVLLHGLSSSSASYADLGPRLADVGWRVVALDFRGHGASDRVAGTYVIEHYAADVSAFLGTLDAPAVLVGHSLGGATAVYLGGARPDAVAGVFAEDPPLYHGMPGVMAAEGPVAAFVAMRDRMRELAGAAPAEVRAALAAVRTPEGSLWADTVVPDAIDARVESFRDCDPDVFDPAIEGRALAGWDPERPVPVPLTILRADPALGAALTPDQAESFVDANPQAVVVEIPGAPHGIREHAATASRYLDELDRFLAGLA